MKFSTAFIVCAILAPAAAVSSPAIVALDDPENGSIRVIEDNAITTSPRPMQRPSGLGTVKQAEIFRIPVGLFGSDFRLTETGSFSSLDDVMAGNFRLPEGEERGIAEKFLLASAGLIDDAEPAIETTLISQAPLKALSPIENATIGRLVNRYEPSVTDSYDVIRLFDLADGKRPAFVEQEKAVNVVDSEYTAPISDAPKAEIISQPETPAQDPYSGFSNEQVAAIIMAMSSRGPQPANYLYPAPAPAAMMAPQPQMQVATASPQSLEGVPSLDYRGDELPAASEITSDGVPEGASPFSPEVLSGAAPQPAAYQAQAYGVSPYYPPQYQQPQFPMQPAIVGDGSNLLLAGWKVGLTGSGGVGLFIDGDPSSIVEISEGMVVGNLGSVEDISFQNGEIIASFTSGESVRGPAKIVMSISGGNMIRDNNEQSAPENGSNERTFSG